MVAQDDLAVVLGWLAGDGADRQDGGFGWVDHGVELFDALTAFRLDQSASFAGEFLEAGAVERNVESRVLDPRNLHRDFENVGLVHARVIVGRRPRLSKILPTRTSGTIRKARGMRIAFTGGMKNIGKGDGMLRGLCLGTALALLMILGTNLLGSWQESRASGDAGGIVSLIGG